MKFTSTRGAGGEPLSFSAALEQSLAGDGGLYVPERFPSFRFSDFEGLNSPEDIGARMLAPFFEGDALEQGLPAILKNTLNFPLPLIFLREETAVLELFHGPTAAFKDVGARFLAECLTALPRRRGRRTILVATSGDTGGAVAAAFHGKPGIDVVILFPKGKVSARQEKQLTCWGENVRAFRVLGDFDDCQRLAKEAFADAELARRKRLLSANSINIGRLLPQTVYYAAASLWYTREKGQPPGVIVPSGNLGNGLAALWAKRMGFPIRKVVLASNANRALPDYLATGHWDPKPTIATLANAMDVGNPSNMERIRHLYPDVAELKRDVESLTVTDDEIRDTIRRGQASWRKAWCPHTATAVFAREKLNDPHWIIVATAHPAKFETIVEPLIGAKLTVPPALAELLKRPSRAVELEPDLSKLRALLDR